MSVQPPNDPYAQYGYNQYGAPQGQQYGPQGQQYGHNPYGPPGMPPYGPPMPAPVGYASWGLRVGSGLIDAVAPSIVFNGLITLAGTEASGSLNGFGLLMVIGWLAFVIWNSGYRQGTTGQSLGKQVVGTRLVRESTGLPAGFGLAFGREIAHILDRLPLGLGYLWPLWDAKRQTFADKICSTIVVRDAA